jgi:hypothetical protein
MSLTSRTALRRAIPLAIAGLSVTPALLYADEDVRCLGTEAVCTANVELDGGASNEKVMVQLPGTALKLRATTPVPASLKGAFSASGGRYTTGGSVYQFTLNAVGSITDGYASMTFTNPARPQSGPAARVRCLGGDDVCTAHVSLRGGASNKRIRVLLPGTDLKLASGARAVTPASSRGAYSIGRGSYSEGGSVYAFTLNAVGSLGKGAWLALTFRDPS